MIKVTGKIISNSLGYVGKQEIPYGYIDVVTKEGKVLHIKVDVHTFHETLTPGYEVEIEMDTLESTNILVAKAIYIIGEIKSSRESAKAST